jgi:folylpolyglutamate synthase/dihydropteroate synthase
MEKFTVASCIDVIIDGSHNKKSVELCLQSLKSVYGDLTVVFGAGKDKNIDDMLEMVYVYSQAIMFVKSKHFKSVPEEELKNLFLLVKRDRKLELTKKSDPTFVDDHWNNLENLPSKLNRLIDCVM